MYSLTHTTQPRHRHSSQFSQSAVQPSQSRTSSCVIGTYMMTAKLIILHGNAAMKHSRIRSTRDRIVAVRPATSIQLRGNKGTVHRPTCCVHHSPERLNLFGLYFPPACSKTSRPRHAFPYTLNALGSSQQNPNTPRYHARNFLFSFDAQSRHCALHNAMCSLQRVLATVLVRVNE